MFDKVVVITDRVVLDRQLQETDLPGSSTRRAWLQKIDQDSAQLAAALAGKQAGSSSQRSRSSRSSLDKATQVAGKRFAVIVDEAHSSRPARRPRS